MKIYFKSKTLVFALCVIAINTICAFGQTIPTSEIGRDGALYGLTDCPVNGNEIYTWYNSDNIQVAQFVGHYYFSPSELDSYYLIVTDPDTGCMQAFNPREVTELNGCCELEEGSSQRTALDYITNFKESETWKYSSITSYGEEIPFQFNPCFGTYYVTFTQELLYEDYNENCPIDPPTSGTFTINEDETKLYFYSYGGEVDSVGITSLQPNQLNLLYTLSSGVELDLVMVPN